MPQPEQGLPHRAVDASDASWMATDGPAGEWVYALSGGDYRTTVTWQELQERGPLRHVEPPPDGDTQALVAALVSAGTKAVGTYAAALYAVALAGYVEGKPGRDLLTAGRPGSWESHTVRNLAWDVGSGIAPSRVDQAAVAVVTGILHRWVWGPGPFVEVAENMADVLGEVVDQLGGWARVADRWLRIHQGAESIEGYVTSRAASRH